MTISAAFSDADEKLLAAAATDGLQAAEDLIQQGADVDCRSERDGRTPLHVAALNGQMKMAQLLLKKGASVEVFDDSGDAPLHLAARGGHHGLVTLFILRGINVELANSITGETPLMAAAQGGGLKAIDQLVASSANIEAQDRSGETALMKAAKANQPGAVEKLISEYADIFTPSNSGKTAFELAKEANAGAACVALYPHVEANDREKTYNMAQKLRATNKFSVGKPLKFKKPGDA